MARVSELFLRKNPNLKKIFLRGWVEDGLGM